MSDFKTRLVEEKSQLDEKIEKLSPFVEGSVFPSLPVVQQSLLKAQLGTMKTYSQILSSRLENLD